MCVRHDASLIRAALYNTFVDIRELEDKHGPEAMRECIRTMDAVLLDDYLAKPAVVKEALDEA